MWEPYIHWSEYAQNVAITIASLGTLVLGIFGYNKWKSELTGKKKYNLSREILTELFNIRKQVNHVRKDCDNLGNDDVGEAELAQRYYYSEPTYSSATQGMDVQNLKRHLEENKKDEENPLRVEAREYDRGLQPLSGSLQKLHKLSLEAQLVHGKEYTDFENLAEHLRLLFKAYKEYYSETATNKDAIVKILYHQENDDEYKSKLESLLSLLEKRFSKYST